MQALAQRFRREMVNPRRKPDRYLKSAQKLYQVLIAPIERDLRSRGIQNLVFILDTGIRSLPLAALHDGRRYLVEKYSVGLMPALSLTDTRYTNIRTAQVLAAGASEFAEQSPLPAVSVELSVIAESPWQGETLLNEAFTLDNLINQRQQRPFGIIHLATHAAFTRGSVSDSYIQLWDTKLRLDQLRELGWNIDPAVELAVLSACETAIGNENAELGFAGMAAQAGVKSVLASLWLVSDEGTLGLMSEFYQHLKKAPIRAEALRRAQLAMLKGQIKLQGRRLLWSGGSIPLPPEMQLSNRDFTDPYFWSGFTMVGSPW